MRDDERSSSEPVPGTLVKLAGTPGRTYAWIYADPEGRSIGSLFRAVDVGLVLSLRSASVFVIGEGRRSVYLISSAGSVGWAWVDNLEVIR